MKVRVSVVDYLNLASRQRRDEDILRFQVAVDHFLLVEALQCEKALPSNLTQSLNSEVLW